MTIFRLGSALVEGRYGRRCRLVPHRRSHWIASSLSKERCVANAPSPAIPAPLLPDLGERGGSSRAPRCASRPSQRGEFGRAARLSQWQGAVRTLLEGCSIKPIFEAEIVRRDSPLGADGKLELSDFASRPCDRSGTTLDRGTRRSKPTHSTIDRNGCDPRPDVIAQGIQYFGTDTTAPPLSSQSVRGS